MTPSNLPPGCSINDIPGNRPEDLAEEAFWDAYLAEAEKRGLLEKAMLVAEDEVDGTLYRLTLVARDVAYGQGFAEGRDDERMAQGAAEMDRIEQFQSNPTITVTSQALWEDGKIGGFLDEIISNDPEKVGAFLIGRAAALIGKAASEGAICDALDVSITIDKEKQS